jgi:tetraacyldisaccharide-1-P 4'-kinase
LEDVTQMAVRNIDYESAGASTAWSATLARCLCVSAEYGASVRNAKSEDQASKRSADVGDEAMSPADGLDLAGKLKAFSEARRAVAATTACSSVISTIVYECKTASGT